MGLFSRGWAGVEIFFVISGFVIPYSYSGRASGFAGILRFYKGSVIRVALVCYVALGFYVSLYFTLDRLIGPNTTWFNVIFF
jgi:peptidoglycan/LPS O-acetylase OafA/YrhL